jgi:hypothetical protein
MVNITLTIPEDIHKLIKKHNEINWSEIVRRTISKQVMKLEIMDAITSKSKLTLKDIQELNEKIKEGLLKKYVK